MTNSKNIDKCDSSVGAKINQQSEESESILVYEKPELICYGDVRDITLGPSPGTGESGAGTFFLLP